MKKIFVGVFAGLLLLVALDALLPPDLSSLADKSKVIKGENGKWLYTTTNSVGRWRYAVDITRLDPGFIKLLLMFEDQRFYQHFGVDFIALARSLISSIKAGRIVSGASTITMQLARLMDPKPRTIKSKLIEMLRALQLEWHYDKEQILSWYLSKTPYGGNIEGIEAASRVYFAKAAHSLTLAQAALLTALPQAPERLRPDRFPVAALAARNKILQLAQANKVINAQEYQTARQQEVPSARKPLPRYAPHLAQYVLYRQNNNISHTTINVNLQKSLHSWARKQTVMLSPGATVAALIARNSDSAVIAYLGSHDRYNSKTQGYVDMVQAVRSPGSTLKPLIYAMGFDEHVIHPATIINDMPYNFHGYRPTNFNHEFKGNITAAQALQYSLNIPAVLLLDRLKPANFIARIEKISGKLIIPGGRATLPIALGGVGITMAQLLSLYVNIANSGVSYTLKYQPDGTQQKRRIFSPSAMQQVTAIMRKTQPPHGYLDQQDKIAFKTGTSYGYRDAWAIGYNRDYTIALWVGKPTGATNPGHTGRNTAAPRLFELFSLLAAQGIKAQEWDFAPHQPFVPAPLAFKQLAEAKSDMLWLSPAREQTSYHSNKCKLPIIEIAISGGTPPYQWYIDNQPSSITKTRWQWLASGIGAHNITVIDRAGGFLSRNFWVSAPNNCTKG